MRIQKQQAWPVATVKWVSNRLTSSGCVTESRSPVKSITSPDRIPGWKRALDFLLIFTLLPFVLFVSAVLAVYIKLVSPGPVFFRQQRVGFRCRRFDLLKFRTMHVGSDAGVHKDHLDQLIGGNAPMKKMDQHDARLIPLAKWIRAVGLDELPQLFNVIMGDMSLVGPRPCTTYEFEKYEAWQKERFDAVPGLTGLWQVSGKNNTTFNEMMRLDISYARQQSIWLDLYIIIKTAPALYQQVSESSAKRAATESLSSATNTETLTNSTTTTRITGGYEKRTQSGGRRMRVLGT
jgi:exopolysaccharide production protein ExoY